MQIIAAALAYFTIVFAVGFLCGPIRIFLLEPKFGAVGAVLLELPILVMAMLYAARLVPRKLKLAPSIAAHAGMGGGALALLLVADLGVGLLLRGQSFTQILDQFSSAPGRIYAGALLAFAVMPLLVNRRVRT